MAPAKKWRIVYPHLAKVDDFFTSEQAAYDFVDVLRTHWAAGRPLPRPDSRPAHVVRALTVQVDEGLGFGWEPYEHIDFAEESNA